MRTANARCLSIATVAALIAFAPTSVCAMAQDSAGGSAAAESASGASPALDALLDQLGDERYARRAAATREIIALGSAVIPALRARLERETDPEIIHRIGYILENITPPERAVLVVRAEPATGLRPGDLITHLNSRPVSGELELRRRLANAQVGLMLRVRGSHGSREVGPLLNAQLHALADYRAPRGARIARVLRRYADGLVEQAWEDLRELGEPIPPDEMSLLLRARIAYTAGDGAAALALLSGKASAVGPAVTGSPWRSESQLDRAGPGKAPFHLEWVLWGWPGAPEMETAADPDLRVQRVLVAAGRYVDALRAAAGYWWTRYRGDLGRDSPSTAPGNMLAVSAWMLSDLNLLSECTRLIRPRSDFLSYTWMRVQTEAWLPFLGGDAQEALDGLYDEARQVLQRPPRPRDPTVLTRVPRVAAQAAFFVYRFPNDPRVAELLEAVNLPGHPALSAYTDWMLFALRSANRDVIRQHLQAILPSLGDAQAPPYAVDVALLEYVRGRPDDVVLLAARERLARSAPGAQEDSRPALIDTLRHMAAGRLPEARQAFAPCADEPEFVALRHTLDFLSDPPPTAANHAALQAPLLAVPIGQSRQHWLVLTRDRRLKRFEAEQSLLTAIDDLTPSWFPGPVNWPWIGREESTGRVWVYDRRRILEVGREDERGLRLSIRVEDIPAFARHVGPVFSVLADAVAAVPSEEGERGEFLRSEIGANGEYVADPDLPEVGLIRRLSQDRRIVHVAMRGGPHLLVDATTGKAWTSPWIGQQLGLDRPPTFFAQAVWDRPAPLVFLMSDQGLIRFDVGAESLKRMALPGDEPYPPLIPESTPYVRRDPRYVYCARLPEHGGRVYRLTLADDAIEAVDMINEALPPWHYEVRSRAAIRREIDRRFEAAGLPTLEEFIRDTTETVARRRP